MENLPTNQLVTSLATHNLKPKHPDCRFHKCEVVLQGLAPGPAGLYQINVVLLETVPGGDEVPVVIEQDGITRHPLAAVRLPAR